MDLREWQKDAVKILDKVFTKTDHQLVSVAASVGSGKTLLASYLFGKFIADHCTEKTVSMFVAPRISLCKQQEDEIAVGIERLFGLKRDTDFALHVVNCESKDYNKFNDEYVGQHTVFVICDESLWGTDVNGFTKFNLWVSKFTKWKEQGIKFGAIVYDEAHNFKNQIEYMINSDVYKELPKTFLEAETLDKEKEA